MVVFNTKFFASTYFKVSCTWLERKDRQQQSKWSKLSLGAYYYHFFSWSIEKNLPLLRLPHEYEKIFEKLKGNNKARKHKNLH